MNARKASQRDVWDCLRVSQRKKKKKKKKELLIVFAVQYDYICETCKSDKQSQL